MDSEGTSASEEAAVPLEKVSGPYVASDRNAPYEALFFEGADYQGWKASCTTPDECVEKGTFSLDVAAQTITFRDGASGASSTFGVEGRPHSSSPLVGARAGAGIRPQAEVVTCLLILGGFWLLNAQFKSGYEAGYSDAKNNRPRSCR